jgi:hypothetical protein
LWLPGMSAVVDPGRPRASWIVVRSGRYDIHASELLPKHPWFTAPSRYIFLHGPQFAIPLDRLPKTDVRELQWVVNGIVQPAGVSELELKRGGRLELVSSSPRSVGVFVVPHGVMTLSTMPEGDESF